MVLLLAFGSWRLNLGVSVAANFGSQGLLRAAIAGHISPLRAALLVQSTTGGPWHWETQTQTRTQTQFQFLGRLALSDLVS